MDRNGNGSDASCVSHGDDAAIRNDAVPRHGASQTGHDASSGYGSASRYDAAETWNDAASTGHGTA